MKQNFLLFGSYVKQLDTIRAPYIDIQEVMLQLGSMAVDVSDIQM